MKHETSSINWKRIQQGFLTFLIGSIPTQIVGGRLRNLFYRPIFARLGSSVFIQHGVTFCNTHNMEIGNGAYILQGVRLNAKGHPNNKLVIGDGVVLEHGFDVRAMHNTCIHIEQKTYIGPYVCLAGPGDIQIGKNCLIAPHVGIFANNHIFDDPTRIIEDQGVTRQGIKIGDDCWLGHGVTVLDGVIIGEGCVVGAGSVVAKDLPPYSVAVGVPARVVKSREQTDQAKSSVLTQSN
ncbi:MAG: acyltransferase [Scytonema sp. PMC 1069.18]|nr:acyltransferase [Scytonema sp. PMC 1069.18]MEC4885822.1 acyltransferase [Scytonema sp. PMC 1070.18]